MDMGRKLVRVTDERFLAIAAKKFEGERVKPMFERGEDGYWRISNALDLPVAPSYYMCAMMKYDDNPIWDDYNGEPI